MTRVFISYSRSDELFAQRISTSLSDAGVEVWIDVKDIPLGMKWSTAIQQGLDSCEIMLVIISPDSMSSKNVEDEWQYFLDHQKRVVPVLWKPTKIQFQLNRLQYIDFSSSDYLSALSDLLTALGVPTSTTQQLRKRAYDILTREYETWSTFGKKDSQLLDYDMIEIIFDNIAIPNLSKELKTFLLWSYANIKQPEKTDNIIRMFKNWITEIQEDDLKDLIKETLKHPNSFIRSNLVKFVRDVEIKNTTELLIELLAHEGDSNVRNLVLATLYKFNAVIPTALASTLLEAGRGWLTKTYALNNYKPNQAALLISDGTQFSHQFQNILESVGFEVIELYSDVSTFLDWEVENLHITTKLLEIYDLIAIIRGEHYGNIGNTKFYQIIRDYVLKGGRLFATAWVGWETQQVKELAELLPFQYQSFIEDVNLHCYPTNEPLAKELFNKQISYTTSFEYSVKNDNATLLLVAQDNIPVFGYKKAGLGLCYYLNSCQHSCTQKAISPFTASTELKHSIKKVAKWIYDNKLDSDNLKKL